MQWVAILCFFYTHVLLNVVSLGTGGVSNTPFTLANLIRFESGFALVERSHALQNVNRFSEMNGIKLINLLRFNFEQVQIASVNAQAISAKF